MGIMPGLADQSRTPYKQAQENAPIQQTGYGNGVHSKAEKSSDNHIAPLPKVEKNQWWNTRPPYYCRYGASEYLVLYIALLNNFHNVKPIEVSLPGGFRVTAKQSSTIDIEIGNVQIVFCRAYSIERLTLYLPSCTRLDEFGITATFTNPICVLTVQRKNGKVKGTLHEWLIDGFFAVKKVPPPYKAKITSRTTNKDWTQGQVVCGRNAKDIWNLRLGPSNI